jgi:beta-mannosidase
MIRRSVIARAAALLLPAAGCRWPESPAPCRHSARGNAGFRFDAFFVLVAAVAFLPAAARAQQDFLLDDDDWRMGSYSPGEGEKAGAYKTDFDDRSFRVVTVPGDTQLQAGLTGIGRFVQTKELMRVNQKEWWYRKHFRAPKQMAGTLARLVFDGSDYFTAVWLNGKLIGNHEGTYTEFSFDVSRVWKPGGENVLAVRVTHPWIPKDRGLSEYLNGDFSMSQFWDNTPIEKPPYFLDVHWDALPADGNAAFAMGIWRSVHLRQDHVVRITGLYVRTKSLNPDGSASLEITVAADNATAEAVAAKMRLSAAPENFAADAQDFPALNWTAVPGDSSAHCEVVLRDARLWWSWDHGAQPLYRLSATLEGAAEEKRAVRFGVRTIQRDAGMGYRLNGRRIFIRASWFPIEDSYRSTPTADDYERDLRLFRNANFNLLVNFTVVEKPAFYDLCDELGILVVTEMPFQQFGPIQVLDKNSPRREPFLAQARLQISSIVRALRNHPSIIEWAPLAEAHDKGGSWGFGGFHVSQEGYETFVGQMRTIVNELAPDAIFHPSLCDLGEQHFWMAAAGQRWSDDNYQAHFDAAAGFISEYGGISMSSAENLGRILRPEQIWNAPENGQPRWYGLPIDNSAYAYWTSFGADGLYSMLYRTRHFVDAHTRSATELARATQVYQAFVLRYATEAYRRKKYQPVMGIRSWDFLELAPGFRFGIVDYDRVPKIAYWEMKRALAPLAISFAFRDELESQIAGSTWAAPVWVINDRDHAVRGNLRVSLLGLDGRTIDTRSFRVDMAADSRLEAGRYEVTLPEKAGVYVAEAVLTDAERQSELARKRMFVKVVPKVFAQPVRVLLIGQSRYSEPLAAMLRGLSAGVDVYDENALSRMETELKSADSLRQKYEVIWVASFAGLAKVLPETTVRAIRNAVRAGVSFVHSGGEGSFHGGNGHAAVMEGTPLGEVLPVRILERGSDLALPGHDAGDELSSYPRLHGITGSGEWSRIAELLGHAGLAGYNRTQAKPSSTTLLQVAGQPLLVEGSYGKGRTFAFTGFTPPSAESRHTWSLDERLSREPVSRAFFAAYARILAQAVGTELDVPALVDGRIEPLFEILKDLPPASVSIEPRAGATKSFVIRNQDGYAHLVHLRIEWPQGIRPYIAELSDNDFDLMPGESRRIALTTRTHTKQGETPECLVKVTGANVKPAEAQ